MNKPLSPRRKIFRLIGNLEAASFLILLGVAMPLKYMLGYKWATQVPGLAHGILFMAYLYLAVELHREEKWTKNRLWLAFVASVLPLGTVIFDWKVLTPDERVTEKA